MPAFRTALLLFNPISGSGLQRREAVVRGVAEVFRGAGVQVQIEATRAAGSAGDQARAAIDGGCEAVFACGGDGTAFDVLQGIAQSSAMMGVIPLGTGNILAHDLGLADRPERAAAQLLTYMPRTISLGRIETMQRCTGDPPRSAPPASAARYFTVAAGVGSHAEVLYQLTAGSKQSAGYLAYYMHGARLLLTRPFVEFPVEITLTDGTVLQTTTLELLAVRVSSFGGPLRRWRPGSSLGCDELRLCLVRDASRAQIMGYLLQALAGMARYQALEPKGAAAVAGDQPRGFCFVSARSLVCHSPAAGAAELRAQADGELLGQTPAKISIVPRAVRLLAPAANI